MAKCDTRIAEATFFLIKIKVILIRHCIAADMSWPTCLFGADPNNHCDPLLFSRQLFASLCS